MQFFVIYDQLHLQGPDLMTESDKVEIVILHINVKHWIWKV